MVRPSCCDKPNVQKALWSAEENANILEHEVSKNGKANWTSVPRRPGLRRCGKSCRLRWSNHLRADLNHESFTPKEEELIIKLHATIGSRWPLIAQQLPGRTDSEVKNHWNTKLRKKLSNMGIDPVTHKPFSQILADYGNIGGFPNMRIGSLNKDMKNAIFMKTEPPFSAPPPPPKPGMVSPKTEQNPPSLDLLAQLQAIKFVTNQASISNPTAFSFSTSSSPSSASSSTCAAQETMSPPPAFNWNDFLLEDALLPSGAQEEENVAEFSPHKVLLEGPKEDGEVNETSSICQSSFVEALLATENEMLLEFPQLLQGPFY